MPKFKRFLLFFLVTCLVLSALMIVPQLYAWLSRDAAFAKRVGYDGGQGLMSSLFQVPTLALVVSLVCTFVDRKKKENRKPAQRRAPVQDTPQGTPIRR